MRTSARRWATGVTAIAFAAGVTACGSSGKSTGSGSGSSTAAAAVSKASGSSGKTFTVWDPYPQLANNSAWVKTLDACGAQAGVKIKRTAFDTTSLTTKELLAAQQKDSPNVLVVDNPVVSTLVSAGVLTSSSQTVLSTAGISANLLGAGTLNGKSYGVPIGANTIALYYNKAILAKAGVNPSSIKNWATLTAALAKIKATGNVGITFSAIGTEEGTFQWLPYFWGAGGNLTNVDSTAGKAALNLWSDWLKKGYAQNGVLNDTQPDNFTSYQSGKVGISENGTWELAPSQTGKFKSGVIPIPGENGGSAPTPLGGEFVTIPVQSNTATYATSAKIVACLTKGGNALKTDTALGYIAANPAIQSEQLKKAPDLATWVSAVHTARGRTADNLGVAYPKISQQIWTALQSSLSGSSSVDSALAKAQSAASSATNGK